ncbi:hypothetical protein SEA_SHROOMS_34 [Arthrobacter phage Shrooms]|nr:hypothetical protein SEA_SHROOMS_34 [Arthrobacter phage Shrooms]
MPLRPAVIESNGMGRGTVTVDGMDLSEAVGRVEFTSRPGSVDSLILTTNVAAQLSTAGAEVVVDEQTRNALICLGWTAPTEDLTPTTAEAKRETWNTRLGENSCRVDNPCDACLDRPATDRSAGNRVSDPRGIHEPTLRGALDAYLDGLPSRYTPVVKGIRALMSYYPMPQPSDPVTCRCFTG